MGDPQNHGCQYQNGQIWDDLNFECPLWLRKPIIFNTSDDFGWGRQTRANPSDQQPGSLAAVVSAPEFLTVVFAAFNILSLLRASWRMVDGPSMVFHKNRSWMRNQEPAITNTLRVWESESWISIENLPLTLQPHSPTKSPGLLKRLDSGFCVHACLNFLSAGVVT